MVSIQGVQLARVSSRRKLCAQTKKKVCEDEQEKVCRGSKHSYRRFDDTQKKVRGNKKTSEKCVF